MKIKRLTAIIITCISVTAQANTEIADETVYLDGKDIEYYFSHDFTGSTVQLTQGFFGSNLYPGLGNNVTINPSSHTCDAFTDVSQVQLFPQLMAIW